MSFSPFYRARFHLLEGPKLSRDSLLMVAATNGVQMGPGQTALAVSNGLFDLGTTHLTRTPFSLTIWLESPRVKATMAPLVAV